jgi:excisionase family DNA binding protein
MTTQHEMDRLLTCEQVAEALGLRVSTIRRMILERRIDTVRPSRRAVRIPERAVQAILERGYRPAVNGDGEVR